MSEKRPKKKKKRRHEDERGPKKLKLTLMVPHPDRRGSTASSKPASDDEQPAKARKRKLNDLTPEETTELENFALKQLIKSLLKAHEEISSKDSYQIFQAPVTEDIAPKYFEIVKNPMDFGTMLKNIHQGEYSTFDEYQKHMELVCNNCMTYNTPDTLFFQQALKLQKTGVKIIAREKKACEKAVKRERKEIIARKKAKRQAEKAEQTPVLSKDGSETTIVIPSKQAKGEKVTISIKTPQAPKGLCEHMPDHELLAAVARSAKRARRDTEKKQPKGTLSIIKTDAEGNPYLHVIYGTNRRKGSEIPMKADDMKLRPTKLPDATVDVNAQLVQLYPSYYLGKPWETPRPNRTEAEADKQALLTGDFTCQMYLESLKRYVDNLGVQAEETKHFLQQKIDELSLKNEKIEVVEKTADQAEADYETRRAYFAREIYQKKLNETAPWLLALHDGLTERRRMGNGAAIPPPTAEEAQLASLVISNLRDLAKFAQLTKKEGEGEEPTNTEELKANEKASSATANATDTLDAVTTQPDQATGTKNTGETPTNPKKDEENNPEVVVVLDDDGTNQEEELTLNMSTVSNEDLNNLAIGDDVLGGVMDILNEPTGSGGNEETIDLTQIDSDKDINLDDLTSQTPDRSDSGDPETGNLTQDTGMNSLSVPGPTRASTLADGSSATTTTVTTTTNASENTPTTTTTTTTTTTAAAAAPVATTMASITAPERAATTTANTTATTIAVSTTRSENSEAKSTAILTQDPTESSEVTKNSNPTEVKISEQTDTAIPGSEHIPTSQVSPDNIKPSSDTPAVSLKIVENSQAGLVPTSSSTDPSPTSDATHAQPITEVPQSEAERPSPVDSDNVAQASEAITTNTSDPATAAAPAAAAAATDLNEESAKEKECKASEQSAPKPEDTEPATTAPIDEESGNKNADNDAKTNIPDADAIGAGNADAYASVSAVETDVAGTALNDARPLETPSKDKKDEVENKLGALQDSEQSAIAAMLNMSG